jgi:hypothetical protein
MVPIVVGLADEDSQSLGWTLRYQRELLSRRAPRRPAAMARPTRRPNHDAARALPMVASKYTIAVRAW